MKRSVQAVLAMGSASVILSACGAGDNGDDADSGGLTTVNVGAIPVVDAAALYIGEDQGFFAEEGLELEIELGQGSAAMIPALLNGQHDILYGGSINALQATDRELPLTAIAVGGRTTGVEGEDHGAMLVGDDSDIESPADLEGQDVAVNALRGLHEVAVWASVRADGGDPAQVNFVELPLPDMGGALDSGQVDAAATSEPFVGVLTGEGAVSIGNQFVDADPELVTALYFATTERAESDPELVDSFTRALERSFEHADENPDAVRDELPNFTDIEPDQIESMVLTRFEWGLNKDDLRLIADLAADAEALDDPEGATELIGSYVEDQ